MSAENPKRWQFEQWRGLDTEARHDKQAGVRWAFYGHRGKSPEGERARPAVLTESIVNVCLRHKSHIRSKYGNFGRVSGGLKRDSDWFVTEVGAFQKSFGLGAV